MERPAILKDGSRAEPLPYNYFKNRLWTSYRWEGREENILSWNLARLWVTDAGKVEGKLG